MTIDRKGWSRGPWDDEPDRAEWRHAGFACLIVRQGSGVLCGYVGVPPGHPWHGQKYNDIEADVHGGLTYGDHCQGRICHVPEPGEPEHLFWLGFDCHHAGDYAPGDDARFANMHSALFGHGPGPDQSYRAIPYVRREVNGLAEQAAIWAVFGRGLPEELAEAER